MAATPACLVTVVVALTYILLEVPAPATAESWLQRRREVRSILSRVNKNPLATIESSDGDIIDCVHISEQPAFDHPLLANHTIKMRPYYYPGGMYHDPNIPAHPVIQTWHENGECPENTIPIRRTTKEDALRATSILKYGKKRPRSIVNLNSMNEHASTNVLTDHQYAVAYSVLDKCHGTQITINLWQPMITRAGDFSLTQLWIIGGSHEGGDLNTIEAGWQVFPEFYGDCNTRLFIYWTRDAYKTTGCYNLLCSGFVQTNNQITIGGSISSVSTYGGTQYDLDIFVWKDLKGGNWWLRVGSHDVGYWPSSIYTYLADSASYVMWGGEVYSPDAGQTSTQMGSGHFPEEGLGKASHIKNIQLVDSSNNFKPASDMHLISEQHNYYIVQNGTNGDLGSYIYYGGPGEFSSLANVSGICSGAIGADKSSLSFISLIIILFALSLQRSL